MYRFMGILCRKSAHLGTILLRLENHCAWAWLGWGFGGSIR